jgi:hypothetical protein
MVGRMHMHGTVAYLMDRNRDEGRVCSSSQGEESAGNDPQVAACSFRLARYVTCSERKF